jgi:hypothetical protein
VPRPGRRFTLFIDTASLHLFDPVTEQAIYPAPNPIALLAAAQL